MNEGQSMGSDALRRAIVRISLVELALSLTWLGLAFSRAVGRYDDRTVFTVTGVIFGIGTLLFLFEPLIAGISRQQLPELRPQLRPSWFYVVFLSMFVVYAIVTFPGVAKTFGFKVNVVTALLAMTGISGFLGSTFNLAKSSRS